MVSETTTRVMARAKQIYAEHREGWLAEYRDQYVAIEPKSGEYLMAETFDAAVKAARTKHPTRLSHTIRIGHDAAFSIGCFCWPYDTWGTYRFV